MALHSGLVDFLDCVVSLLELFDPLGGLWALVEAVNRLEPQPQQVFRQLSIPRSDFESSSVVKIRQIIKKGLNKHDRGPVALLHLLHFDFVRIDLYLLWGDLPCAE